ncbi:golvesin C-terminal-like domain-containing protein [Phytohabitans sp. LJ34]|uniref:golvesin C-terminal-like domain-containing protein n=1 Tax=Phytohabitans sp. LJ34 TaxID=3452217 RepID=UPI003F8994C3
MIARRTFTIGLAAGAATVAVGPRAFASPPRNEPFFHETTLWDSTVDPLENYHVHGLVVLPNDTILAATEGRYEVCDAGPRDLLVRRSPDGGETWGPTQTVVSSVDGQSWGNPAFVADRITGEVFLFYMLSERLPENTTCSGDSGDLYVVSSKDGGRTWGEPRPLAGLFDHFPYDWALHGPGPGHGIQLDDGRLLINVAHRRVIVGNTVAQRFYGMAGLYSDDHGRTWQATGEVPVSVEYPINEARLVQRDDGPVVVNGRAAAGGNRQRIVAVSQDRGLTWSPPKLDGATGVFNAVDASLVRYTGGPRSHDIDRILFSRPDAPMRWNMTVSVSYDEGHSFRYSRVVNPNRSYYSDLARLSDGTIVLLYGCDGDIPSFPRRIALARFNLEWLTQGRDSLSRGPRLTEHRHDLGRTAPHARRPGGTVAVVREPTARDGARAVYTPHAAGDYIEYPFEAGHGGVFEVWLRYYRPVAGGLVAVTIDGRAPRVAAIDTTAESADGYDVVRLDRLRLGPGRHRVRFTLAGPGRGGGQLISLDELSLVEAPGPADVREDITIDNGEQGFQVVAGTWPGGTGVPGYYGSNYTSHAAGDGTAAVRWRPAIPGDDRYEVRVSYSAASNRATNATYVVHHAGGSTPVAVDQRVRGVPGPRGGEWVSLGTFPFTAGLDGRVELSDAANGVVVADAVQWVRTSSPVS